MAAFSGIGLPEFLVSSVSLNNKAESISSLVFIAHPPPATFLLPVAFEIFGNVEWPRDGDLSHPFILWIKKQKPGTVS